MVRWLVVAIAALTAACSLGPARQGGVRIISNVPEATLYVDEELRGPAEAYQQRYLYVRPGTHRIMLEHPRYFTEYVEVTVPENMGMAVQVEMRQRPQKR